MPWGYAAAAVAGSQLLGGGGGSGGSGGGGGGNATQTTTNYNAVSNYAAPYVENMLGKTEALVAQPYQAYPGQRTADFTGLQNKAFGQAGQLGVNPLTQQGGIMSLNAGDQYNQMATNPYATQAFMSPYMQNVVNTQMREANRNYDISNVAQQAQATRAGAFGGGREAIMRAENERNRNTALAGIQAQGLQSAFQNAQQAQQFGATLGLQGANQAANIGQNIYGQQVGNINLQNQLGTQQQQQQQNILNQQYQDFLAQKQDPYNKLAFQQSMLSGLPITSNVQNVYSNPSMLSQVAGLGTAAAGAYGMYNSMNKAKGGVIKESKRPAGLAELALSKMG